VAGQLGARVRRIPDGETGVRTGWVGFQIPLLAEHESFEIVPSGDPGSLGLHRAAADYLATRLGCQSAG
jgi:hypothetical protein